MAGYPPPYPPQQSYGPDWKQQRRIMRDQARMQRQAMRQRAQLYRAHMRSMRRGSILGPLMLIVIGTIFLLVQTGYIAASHAWNWYGRWWPMLLVAAGIVVLAEWGFDQATASPDNPPIRRGIGGLWLLFIFVICTGLIVHRGVTAGWSSSRLQFGSDIDGIDELLGNRHELDEPYTQPLIPGAGLTIYNPHGGVSISGISDDGQMHIQLHHVIFTGSDSDAESKRQQLKPQISTLGANVTLKVPYLEGTQTDMTITVPAATPLAITANRGSVDVNGTKGTLFVTSDRGDVTLGAINGAVTAHVNNNNSSFTARNVTGAVSLTTAGRDITLADIDGPVIINSQAGGSTHLEHIRGSASYHSGRTQFDAARLDGEFDINGKDLTVDSAVGPVTLTTYSYDILLQHIAGSITVSNNHGSVDLTSLPPLGNATIDNHNGSVTFTVPEKSGFSLQATVANGHIDSDFLSANTQSDTRQNQHLDGTVGNGGSILRVSTTHGDISLRKGDLQPLPPPPAMQKLTLLPPSSSSYNSSSDARQAIADARATTRQAIQNSREALRQSQDAIRQSTNEVRRNSN